MCNFGSSNRSFVGMEPLKVAVVDDTLEDRLIIQAYLDSFPELQCVGVFDSPAPVRTLLMNGEAEAVITDVEMPGMNGLDMIRSLPHSPAVVVMSSYPEYAAGSFDIEALDFLTKPVSMERFSKTVRKLNEWQLQKKSVPSLPEQFTRESFVVKTNSEYVKVRYEDVLFAEAMVDFTTLKTTVDKKMVVLVNLKNLLMQLPSDHFIRCHRSYIVNIHKIKKLGEMGLTLEDGQVLPVGREYEKEVEQIFLGGNLIKRKL